MHRSRSLEQQQRVTSLIAWLDASSEEQRRMRDIIRLFSDRESRDELGLGQIRDALGDGLFPGTSTLHTRARYLLFVPWIFQDAARHSNPAAEADRMERKLITAIRDSDDYGGLLGMQAGSALKTLPSSVYWSMLRRYRILRDPALSMRDVLSLDGQALGGDDIDEGSGGHFRAWSTTMPRRPEGFPAEVQGGFSLRQEEAGWLRDRILDEAPGSLMAHLVVNPPSDDSPAPWADPAAHTVTGEARILLNHAQAFSTVMRGAQLLYNLMLADQYETAGFDRIGTPAAGYRDRLEQWASTLSTVVDVSTWNLDDMLARVDIIRGAPVHPRSVRFVHGWLEILKRTHAAEIADSDEARAFLVRREKQNKGPQARLHNLRRLQTWGGGSGSGALIFRWPNVRAILRDIHDGLESDSEIADA